MVRLWTLATDAGRHFAEEIAFLPLYAKVLLALLVATAILVVGEWIDVPGPVNEKKIAATAPALPPQVAAEPTTTRTDKTDERAPTEAEQSGLSGRFSIFDPKVTPNGSIKGEGRPAFFLSELKPFSAQDVCTRLSGVRWACGLQAYATLHNDIAKKKIDCANSGTVEQPEVSCELGSQNLALVLVKPGLAELKDAVRDPALQKAQMNAKAVRLGIWDR